MTKEQETQLKDWISWYNMFDIETALKRAVKKVFKNKSPLEQEKICNECENINYGF